MLLHVLVNVLKIARKKKSSSFLSELQFRVTTTCLHIFQPLARLSGRFKNHLTPWRNYGKGNYAIPISQKINVWCNNWIAPEDRLLDIETKLKSESVCVERGNIFSRWDLLVKGGALGSIKVFMAAEDHNEGRQFLRFRFIPRLSLTAIFLLAFVSFRLTIALANEALIPLQTLG